MHSSDPKLSMSNRDAVSRLLGRGGRVLAIAAVAHARGYRAGANRWNVLSRENIAATEQILRVIEDGVDPRDMAVAIESAMGKEPATAPPSWASRVWAEPDIIPVIGAVVDDPILPLATGDDREKGLAALAIAMCRSMDGVEALAARLRGGDGEQLLRMARLAQATVEAGEPSEMRSRIRALLAGGG